jgi:hypothetical protein
VQYERPSGVNAWFKLDGHLGVPHLLDDSGAGPLLKIGGEFIDDELRRLQGEASDLSGHAGSS